jgi:hypothetical protein
LFSYAQNIGSNGVSRAGLANSFAVHRSGRLQWLSQRDIAQKNAVLTTG